MKKLILFIAVGLLSLPTFAQDNVMNKGDFMMNIGLGIGSPTYSEYSYGYDYGFGIMPSITVSGEYGMFPTGDIGIVTLGGIASIGTSKSTGYYYNSNAFSTELLFRGAWHLSVWNNPTFDVYAGVGTGVRINSIKYTSNNGTNYENSNGTNFVISEFVGARWMMKENFGLFGEFTNGEISFTKFGITFKF